MQDIEEDVGVCDDCGGKGCICEPLFRVTYPTKQELNLRHRTVNWIAQAQATTAWITGEPMTVATPTTTPTIDWGNMPTTEFL